MTFYVLINTFVSILLLFFFNDLQVPTSNLLTDEKDFPEFEPFEDQATPRSVPVGGEICFLYLIWVQISHILWLVINDLFSLYSSPSEALSVHSIDMCQLDNKTTHHTTNYDIENLVVRRGLQFFIRVNFSRDVTTDDDFQLEFMIGEFWSHLPLVGDT